MTEQIQTSEEIRAELRSMREELRRLDVAIMAIECSIDELETKLRAQEMGKLTRKIVPNQSRIIEVL
ncbi:MAG TPA: hypothetical protein O0X25_01760 [Methanocorpusculum sp.]|nr:hypothetical protein [Methanocorpusculum sp.]HJJ39723.1 hypothetical protein [Methanocorpusculum sp.]HJJ49332.1 hypothetical protein [Methanocorpusculum sp.]HJJ56624.1 hypothetical protein [Methanocorpusculum sp.]